MPMEPMEISAKNSMVKVAGTSNGLSENAVDRMSLDDSVDGKTVPGKSSNKWTRRLSVGFADASSTCLAKEAWTVIVWNLNFE